MFFGYFLNIKKVTPSADFVIGPAKAGAFLFSHTRLPFPPRPLLPFGRISPAAKPRWPVTGPTFWVCRAKSGAAFRCAKPPCAVVRFAAMASPPRTAILPFPSRLRRAGAPTAKPRPLLPFGRISPAAKPGWPVIGPTFWVCRAKSGAAFRCAKPPWAVVRFASMASKPRGRLPAPPFGVAAQNRARHFAARPLGGRPLRGHGFAAPHRPFPLPATAAPPNGIRLLFSDKYEQKA